MSAKQVYTANGSAGLGEKVGHAFMDRLADALAEEMLAALKPELFKEIAAAFAEGMDSQLKELILEAKEGKNDE